MIPVRIDISDVATEFALSKSEAENMVDSAVKRVTMRFAENWRAQAGLELKGSKNTYRNSILIVDEGRFKGVVVLSNTISPVPNMIEQGVSGFDMKNGFSQSAKVKYSKSGSWYLTVPFRWATPGALGESEVFTSRLPDEIYDIARTKSSSKTQLNERVGSHSQVKFSEIPEDLRPNQRRSEFSDLASKKTFEAYQHVSNIYEGIQRNQQTYEKATQGQYVSFRRASQNSDPMSWIHTGIRARRLAEKALQRTNISSEVNFAIEDFLNAR